MKDEMERCWFHKDDIPKLTESQKEMSGLVVCEMGWVFWFRFGELIFAYPG